MSSVTTFRAQLILSFNCAFLGLIPKKTRAIIFTENPRVLTVRAIVEAPLTECEEEQISVALTEILADFPEFVSEDLQVLCSTDPITLQLPEGEHFFFLRYEDGMWE